MTDEEIILKEYEVLRAEILDRTKRQYNTLFWSLTLLVVMFGTDKFRSEIVWTIPFAFSFFGYIWLENSSKIIMLGGYIRKQIEDKLSKNGTPPQFTIGWENYLRDDNNNRNRLISFDNLHIFYFTAIILGSIIYQIWFLSNNAMPDIFVVIIVLNIVFFLFFMIYIFRRK